MTVNARVPILAVFLAAVTTARAEERALGGRIAIVTNRSLADCPATEAVFRKRELPYDVMLCKPEGQSQKDNPRLERVIRGEADGAEQAEQRCQVRARVWCRQKP